MKKIKLSFLFSALLLFFVSTASLCRANQPVTITLPDQVIHQSLSDALPITLRPPNGTMKGVISIDSIDTLKIHNKIITLRGVVSGHNLVVNTMVAGQVFDIQLGSLQLPPISCDLRVRYDKATQSLLVSPQFHQPANSVPNDPTNIVYSLLQAFNGKEYPIDFKDIASFNAQIGESIVPINLQPIDIITQENQLVIKLVPGVGKQAGKNGKK